MSQPNPRLFTTPFAAAADPTTIQVVPDVPNPNDISTKPSLAAYSTGFPARSMAPPQAGGQPFYGQDVNGIFNDITANVQYTQGGNYYLFDAAFQSAISGYNKYAVVRHPASGILYQSLTDANMAPITDTTKWTSFTDGRYLPLTGGQISGSLGVATAITTNGRLAIRNDQNSDIALETMSGEKTGYQIRRFGSQLQISQSKNGTQGKSITTYDSNGDGWDFNTTKLTKNNSPIVTENQFDAVFATQGYQKFPSGLIIQWGDAARTKDVTPVTFPIPFPTMCFNVQLTLNRTVAESGRNVSAAELTATGFNMYATGWELACYYVAIGN